MVRLSDEQWEHIRKHFPEENIPPSRAGRKPVPTRNVLERKTQDGRKLRRYERRWIEERYFGWLQWQRRLLVRWEYYAHNFFGFVQLAAMMILIR